MKHEVRAWARTEEADVTGVVAELARLRRVMERLKADPEMRLKGEALAEEMPGDENDGDGRAPRGDRPRHPREPPTALSLHLAGLCP